MRNLVRHGSALGMVALVLVCGVFSQAQEYPGQSLVWSTLEQHGNVRDLTHLPALPFWQTDPTNLQHQMWSQPGTADLPHYPPLWLPEPEHRLSESPMMPLSPELHKGYREIMLKIIKDFEKATK